MNMAVHFSSATPEWPTPQSVFDELHREFNFTLDPCATPDSAKCSQFYQMGDGPLFTPNADGLIRDWSGERVFMNPPYGRELGMWMEKAYRESLRGAIVVCLIPSRTDTAWWHDFAMRGEIRFIRGRLKFGDAVNSAPFPSAIVVFRPAA